MERLESGEARVTYVVCPLLDLFNHAAGSSTRIELAADDSGAPLAVNIYAGQAAAAAWVTGQAQGQ